jgi:hypothetical protein
MSNFNQTSSTGMWRVVFYERKGRRLHVNRSAPWLPSKELAQRWANWFEERGYIVALEDQFGGLERKCFGVLG